MAVDEKARTSKEGLGETAIIPPIQRMLTPFDGEIINTSKEYYGDSQKNLSEEGQSIRHEKSPNFRSDI